MSMLKKFEMCLKQKMLGNIMTYTFKLIRYCLLMYLKMLEINASKHVSAPSLAWQACLKTTGVELELLTDIDMALRYHINGIKYHIDIVMEIINI